MTPTAPLAKLFRVTAEQRSATVKGMLERHKTDTAAYWAQLLLSVGIATFGLVLSSGAVIIGAMLVAPLMGPIVELAMGLAVGSALLAIRSAIRVGASLLTAVLSAGVLVRLLPFQEVTTEIAARTSPTILDLMVAGFCALTAAFVTIRPIDSASTAAGTSIGISLVPPLCTAGFGLGVGSGPISTGALLLFTANLSAILLFALVVFLLTGYGSVDAAALEADVLHDMEKKGLVARAASRLNAIFGSRHATLFKLILPVGLVLAVFVPLQQALSTVSSEVQARQKVAAILTSRPDLKGALSSAVSLEQGKLTVRLVVVGDPSHASELEEYLHNTILEQTHLNASVSVVGVPDAAAVLRLASAAIPPAPVSKPAPAPVLPVSELTSRITKVLSDTYPEAEAGPLVHWSFSGVTTPPTLKLVHLGQPLGSAGLALLRRALESGLSEPVAVDEQALSPDSKVVADGQALLVEVEKTKLQLGSINGITICVEMGKDPPNGKKPPILSKTDVARELSLPEKNIAEGAQWAIRLSQTACPEPAPPNNNDKPKQSADPKK
ncbi:MAG: DUF389 domain-containing protein [Polyangiaceae bacterium]|nr:DUF389 domain-containing protein [Polyangiaceae bacterium]